MISKFYHVGIHVRNLERSIAFYEMLGFEVALKSKLDDPDLHRMFGLKRFGLLRYALMRQRNDPNGTMLDVVEFVDPPSTGDPPAALNFLGFTRLCFHVPDIRSAYQKLVDAEVDFFYPLEFRDSPDGSQLGMLFFRDPDGNLLEIMDWKEAP